MEHNLSIKNITIAVQGRPIVQSISLDVPMGTLVGLMGANGSGKSTLAYGVAGHPKYITTGGSCLLAGTDITQLSPNARAKAGLLVTFQHPPEIPGVSVRTFFHEAYRALYGQTSWITIERRLLNSLKFVGLAESFVERKLHEGFSGGEKKRLEAAQLIFFKPRCAIIDELDAGLDLDALSNMKKMIEKCREENPQFSALVISHSPELMQRLAPDMVYVMQQGKIQASGGMELIAQLQSRGYGSSS